MHTTSYTSYTSHTLYSSFTCTVHVLSVQNMYTGTPQPAAVTCTCISPHIRESEQQTNGLDCVHYMLHVWSVTVPDQTYTHCEEGGREGGREGEGKGGREGGRERGRGERREGGREGGIGERREGGKEEERKGGRREGGRGKVERKNTKGNVASTVYMLHVCMYNMYMYHLHAQCTARACTCTCTYA